MKKIRYFDLIVLTVILIVFSLGAGGCQNTANKPIAPNYTTPTPTPAPAPTNLTPTPTPAPMTDIDIAKQAVAQADKIAGVAMSSAFVSGKDIYIGLELNPGNNVKSTYIVQNVINNVKNLQPGYNVMATVETKTVSKIKTVAQGLALGNPVSSYQSQINDINKSLQTKIVSPMKKKQ